MDRRRKGRFERRHRPSWVSWDRGDRAGVGKRGPTGPGSAQIRFFSVAGPGGALSRGRKTSCPPPVGHASGKYAGIETATPRPARDQERAGEETECRALHGGAGRPACRRIDGKNRRVSPGRAPAWRGIREQRDARNLADRMTIRTVRQAPGKAECPGRRAVGRRPECER